jgi:hypothetical protein
MRLLKTVLLSTTLMMGATFGSAADLTSGQPSAVNQDEVSAVFAKAQAAFTFNQKLVKGKLLEFLGRYVPEFAHTETVDSSSVKVLTALKGAFELTVQAKTAAETDLATALGRVQEVERAAAAAHSQKEQVERQIAAISQEITGANEARAAAEEATRRVLGEKTAVEETLAGLREKIQTADANFHAEVEQLKAQLQAEKDENARLEEELRTIDADADDALFGANEKIAAAITRGRSTVAAPAAANAGDDLLHEKYDDALPLHAAGVAAAQQAQEAAAARLAAAAQQAQEAAAAARLAAVDEMAEAGKVEVDAIAAAAAPAPAPAPVAEPVVVVEEAPAANAAEIARLQSELAEANATLNLPHASGMSGEITSPNQGQQPTHSNSKQRAAAQNKVSEINDKIAKLKISL